MDWRFYNLSASKAIFRSRTCTQQSYLPQSSHDDYFMNQTRRKPTTRTWCPTLFNKWQRIFYKPSHTDMARYTKVFYYPVMGHGGGGEGQSAPAQGRLNTPTTRLHHGLEGTNCLTLVCGDPPTVWSCSCDLHSIRDHLHQLASLDLERKTFITHGNV